MATEDTKEIEKENGFTFITDEEVQAAIEESKKQGEAILAELEQKENAKQELITKVSDGLKAAGLTDEQVDAFIELVG